MGSCQEGTVFADTYPVSFINAEGVPVAKDMLNLGYEADKTGGSIIPGTSAVLLVSMQGSAKPASF